MNYREEIKKRAGFIHTKDYGAVGTGIDWLYHGADNMDRIMEQVRQTISDGTYNEIHNPTIFGGRNKIDDLMVQAQAMLDAMKQQLENEREGGEEHASKLQKGMNASEDREEEQRKEDEGRESGNII